MEIPFTPKFFRKLEIYSTIKTFKKTTEEKRRWEHIKAILLWTIKDHQNLNSPLTRDRIKEILKGQDLSSEDVNKDIGNLIFYGFATSYVVALKHKNGKSETIQMWMKDKLIFKKKNEESDKGVEIYEHFNRKQTRASEVVKELIEDIESIKFTRKGLEYAEVLWEMENKAYYKYKLFIFFVWLSIISGLILILNSALKVLFAKDLPSLFLLFFNLVREVFNYLINVF